MRFELAPNNGCGFTVVGGKLVGCSVCLRRDDIAEKRFLNI